MKKSIQTLAATAILAAASAPALAQAQTSGQGDTNVGFLTCNASSGWGFIFGSSRSVKCVFSTASGQTARYEGSITKFGVDLGYLSSAVVVWAVLAPSTTLAPAIDLSGNYAGVTGSAAVGVGVGANILVGGSGNHFMLQPVSIEGQTGLNVAAGIAALNLKPAS